MPAAYHSVDNMAINKRKTRIVRRMGADVLDRINNGPRPARTVEYEFSGGVKKWRANNEIYGSAE